VRAAQLRARGSILPKPGALVCLPATLKTFGLEHARPLSAKCSGKGSFMYLAELCCSWIVVGPSLKRGTVCLPARGDQRISGYVMRHVADMSVVRRIISITCAHRSRWFASRQGDSDGGVKIR